MSERIPPLNYYAEEAARQLAVDGARAAVEYLMSADKRTAVYLAAFLVSTSVYAERNAIVAILRELNN